MYQSSDFRDAVRREVRRELRGSEAAKLLLGVVNSLSLRDSVRALVPREVQRALPQAFRQFARDDVVVRAIMQEQQLTLRSELAALTADMARQIGTVAERTMDDVMSEERYDELFEDALVRQLRHRATVVMRDCQRRVEKLEERQTRRMVLWGALAFATGHLLSSRRK
eukprot:PLAT5921.1.p2 GENE.PLAT5921.1~~PLAT5921.1.p2  ORF type:complete len:168 (+),score=74.27 PLAT5921.1:85-588(+)